MLSSESSPARENELRTLTHCRGKEARQLLIPPSHELPPTSGLASQRSGSISSGGSPGFTSPLFNSLVFRSPVFTSLVFNPLDLETTPLFHSTGQSPRCFRTTPNSLPPSRISGSPPVGETVGCNDSIDCRKDRFSKLCSFTPSPG